MTKLKIKEKKACFRSVWIAFKYFVMAVVGGVVIGGQRKYKE